MTQLLRIWEAMQASAPTSWIILGVALLCFILAGARLVGLRRPRVDDEVTLHVRYWLPSGALVNESWEGQVTQVGRSGFMIWRYDTGEDRIIPLHRARVRQTRNGIEISVAFPHPNDAQGMRRYAEADYGGRGYRP